MFRDASSFDYTYAPILNVRPAEMTSLEELPEIEKNRILPVFPLKGWVGSENLVNTIKRIEKSIGARYWIADINKSFLHDHEEYTDGSRNYPRAVFFEIEQLLSAENGYENWCSFISNTQNAIPTLQLGVLDNLDVQISRFADLDRGIVVRFQMKQMDRGGVERVLETLRARRVDNLFLMFDFGQVDGSIVNNLSLIKAQIESGISGLGNPLVAFSASSFPSDFSGYNRGEQTIHERRVFNGLRNEISDCWLIYSDRGGTRANRLGGGGAHPSPRIDYPQKNVWYFLREEFSDPRAPTKEEKASLYSYLAQQIQKETYWQENLHVWGTQQIQLTAGGDDFGIRSPSRATAVRLNIHMHHQINYDAVEMVNTDEEWVD